MITLIANRASTVRRWAGSGFIALGAYQIGLGIYFAVFRPSLLPEDARFIGQPLPPKIQSGAVKLEGNPQALLKLGQWMEPPNPLFPIVTR